MKSQPIMSTINRLSDIRQSRIFYANMRGPIMTKVWWRTDPGFVKC